MLAITLHIHYSLVAASFTSSFTQSFSFLHVADLHHVLEDSHRALEGQLSLNFLELHKDSLHSVLLVLQNTLDQANLSNYLVNLPSRIF
jgi:hypothetical protein